MEKEGEVDVVVHSSAGELERLRARRELVRQYLRLQRELVDGDPASSSYRSTIHAFRQMGYQMISSGFEEDLDRLLRLRVLPGGRLAGTGLPSRPSATIRPV